MSDADNGGGYECTRQGTYGKSLYLPLNVVALKKIKHFKTTPTTNSSMVITGIKLFH